MFKRFLDFAALKSPKDIFWHYFLFLRPHNGSYVVPDCISYQIRLSQQGSPGGSDTKVSAYHVGGPGSIPESEDPLEKEMATHTSILAWRIPWMDEPGGLQSMGSQSRTRLSNFIFLSIA